MNFRQKGFVSFPIMTLLVGGLALGGLLAYGLVSGQELPLWPAVTVALVNVVAAVKLVIDTRKARQQRQAAAPSSPAKPVRTRR